MAQAGGQGRGGRWGRGAKRNLFSYRASASLTLPPPRSLWREDWGGGGRQERRQDERRVGGQELQCNPSPTPLSLYLSPYFLPTRPARSAARA